MGYFPKPQAGTRVEYTNIFCKICGKGIPLTSPLGDFHVLKPSGLFKFFKNEEIICTACNRDLKLKKIIK